MRIRRTAGHDDDRGAALVEAAIVLPLVVLLTFGLIDFAFALGDASTLRSSTRSGARIGAALSKQGGQLQSIVDATNHGLNALSTTHATHLLVYAGPPDQVRSVRACSEFNAAFTGMCVDINAFLSTNVFDPALFLAQWNPNRENTCIGHAWKLGVTLVGNYKAVTHLVNITNTLSATTLIDLEPTASGPCASS